jgi:transcriptional regulator with XRE-family HTH domain
MKTQTNRKKKRIALSVGEAVRFIRELRALSQEQLARLAGIPETAISAIEDDRVPLGMRQAKSLAAALRCHPGMLLFPDWGFAGQATDRQRNEEPQHQARG